LFIRLDIDASLVLSPSDIYPLPGTLRLPNSRPGKKFLPARQQKGISSPECWCSRSINNQLIINPIRRHRKK